MKVYRFSQGMKNQVEFKVIAACMKFLFIVTACTNWTSVFATQEQAQPQELPSLSAVLRRYSNENPTVFRESWVSISPAGMRIVDLTTQSELIKNFLSNQVWMINRRNKTQHEVDVPAFLNRFPELTEYLIGPQTKSNILSMKPCTDWDKSLVGELIWRGRIVEAWNCKESSGVVVSEQLFSNQLGIVVKVKYPGGAVAELIDIEPQKMDKSVFHVDNIFKETSFDEFFEKKRHLDSFSEEE